MHSRHAKTLADIRGTKATIRWKQIEALFEALGGTVRQGRGSRVRVELNDAEAVFHEPHPEPTVGRGTVRAVARFLERAGVE
ncbi:MAG: type II toxin-antitoxin system HicA family toxin [Proteobacteria bacterium]|nr:type II toxin-antitoxin system HicA family toxin [Pseudomonadota bacterium]MDA1058119.1 type II toxin-antitoxin system HicA family toxin [Pseudomonadota bacterium]